MKKRGCWKLSVSGRVWTVLKKRRNGWSDNAFSARPETSAVGGGRCILLQGTKNEPTRFCLPSLQVTGGGREVTADGNPDEGNHLPLQESRMRSYFCLHRRSVKNAFPIRHARSGYSHSPFPAHSPIPQTGGFIRRRS